MKGEGNDEILRQSSSIAEVMRRLRDKIAELDALTEAGEDYNENQKNKTNLPLDLHHSTPHQANPHCLAVGANGFSPTASTNGNSDEDSFEHMELYDSHFGTQHGSCEHKHHNNACGAPIQRRSKEEAEAEEETRLFEDAQENIVATSQMKARYAYIDSVDAETEMHLIFEGMRDYYRYVMMIPRAHIG